MVKSKAINTLSKLSKEEFLKFGKFLSSPYFNSNKNLVKLFKYLKKWHPAYSDLKISKEKLFSLLYENQHYNDAKLRKILSDMYKEIEKFLVIKQLDADRIEYNKLLLRSLDSRKLDGLFISKYSDAKEFLTNSLLGYSYFLEIFLLEWNYVSFHLDRGQQSKIAANIFERGNHAVLFFLSDLFLTLNDINANKNTFGFELSPNLPEKFIEFFDVDSFFKYIDQLNIKNIEFLKIYYLAYSANKNPDNTKYYYELERFAFEYFDRFSKLGQLTVTSYLMNYCSRKYSLGETGFASNLNKLYKVMLKHRLFIRDENGYVRSDIFLKILDNFFHIGKIRDVKSELDRNIKFLHPDLRKNILNYYQAIFYYDSREYEKALKELALIKTNTELFKERLKILQLKIFLELNLDDEAKGLASNFKKFLRNYKLFSKLHLSRFIEFVNSYEELLKIRNKFSTPAFLKLKKELLEKNVAEKSWLSKKLQELDSKR